MLIVRTPFRVSFLGGGTDYPAWYREHGGCDLSAAIDKYCYLNVRETPSIFPFRYRISTTRLQTTSTIEDIEHPLVRETLRLMWPDKKGLDIQHNADLPSRTGVGSSSSFTVGMIQALVGLSGGWVGHHVLADAAIKVERDIVGDVVGSQDQVAAAFGGFNKIVFGVANGGYDFEVFPVGLPRDFQIDLEHSLVLVWTGESRTASDIAKEQVAVTPKKKVELQALQALVSAGMYALQQRNIPDFGRLVGEQWQIKRYLTDKIDTPKVAGLYKTAVSFGMYGGKLLGAGGGGFMLFVGEPDTIKDFSNAIDCTCLPLRFDSMGSQIIYRQP